MASSSSTIYPDQVARLESYNAAICRIVRIDDDRPLGTGFLIAPGVVMTCHHVVPKSAKPGECRAEFYGTAIVDQSDLSTRKVVYFEAIDFDADESKYITSPQNFDAAGKLIAADAGNLDYSILSLMTNPKLAKVRYFDLFNACTASMIEQLSTAHVFQHPDIESRDVSGLWIKYHAIPSSSSLKKKTKKIWTRGEFNLATGPLRKCGEFEIHYASETAPGSSGGPVTDAMGNLIALHYQGKITDCDCPKSTAAPHCNVGVRIDQIVEDLRITGRRQQVEALIEQNTLRTHSRIKQHIVNFYRERKTSILHRGLDCFFSLENIYTDLVIVPHVESNLEGKPFQNKGISIHGSLDKPKTQIKIGQLFEHRESSGIDHKKRVIVYGCNGMGKTTFSERIAVHVAEIWPGQFEIAFLIKLKNLSSANFPNLGKDYSMEAVLAQECGICLIEAADSGASSSREFSCTRKEWNSFLEEFKGKSLLILDGFDEFPSESNRGQGALKNVIRDLEAFFNNILITSRPRTVQFHELEIHDQKEFEIIGFDEKGIGQYIQRFYETVKPSEAPARLVIDLFQARLQEIPSLHDFLRIPINLALACLIFDDNENIFFSTDYKPRFYSSVVNSFYGRFLAKLAEKGEIEFEWKSDHRLNPRVKPFHQVFQKIAWLTLAKDLIQIPEGRIESTCASISQPYDVNSIRSFGFVKFENGSWEFIHSRFQEFFAGLYLANCYLARNKKLRKKVNKQIGKVKFKHNFRPVLAIAASYLSHQLAVCKTKKGQGKILGSLQSLFDDLSASLPKDLVKSYELILFAEFFEEISSPEAITGYNDYVSSAFKLLESFPFSPAVRNIFHSNPKLFSHEQWQSFIRKSSNRNLKHFMAILGSVFRESIGAKLLVEIIKNCCQENHLNQRNNAPEVEFVRQSEADPLSSNDLHNPSLLSACSETSNAYPPPNFDEFIEISQEVFSLMTYDFDRWSIELLLSTKSTIEKAIQVFNLFDKLNIYLIERFFLKNEVIDKILIKLKSLEIPEITNFHLGSYLLNPVLIDKYFNFSDLSSRELKAKFIDLSSEELKAKFCKILEIFDNYQDKYGPHVMLHSLNSTFRGPIELLLACLAQKVRHDSDIDSIFFDCSNLLINKIETMCKFFQDEDSVSLKDVACRLDTPFSDFISKNNLNKMLFEIYLARIELCGSNYKQFNEDVSYVIKFIDQTFSNPDSSGTNQIIIEKTVTVIRIKIQSGYRLGNETINDLLALTNKYSSILLGYARIVLEELVKKEESYSSKVVFCLLKFIRSNQLSGDHWMVQLIADSSLSLFKLFAPFCSMSEFVFLCFLGCKALYETEEGVFVSDSYQVVLIERFNDDDEPSGFGDTGFSISATCHWPWGRSTELSDSSPSSSSSSSSSATSSCSSSIGIFSTTSDFIPPQ